MDRKNQSPETCSSTPPTTLAKPLDNVLASLRSKVSNRAEAEDQAYRQRMAAREQERLERSLGKRYSRALCALETYAVYDPRQRETLAVVRRLIDGIGESVKRGDNILLIGSVGTGKDYLLAAIMYSAAGLGIDVKYVNGQEVFGTFRDRIDTGERDEEYFRELSLPTVLAVSDPLPPAGQPGAWDLQNLYRIVDRRYREMQPTWMTMNAASPEEINQQLSSQVFDRLRHNATIIPCFWPSYRGRSNA